MVENRFFIELQMIFGACPAHYYVLGNMIKKLALTDSGIPRGFISRAVNYQPLATPESTTWGERFEASYKRICSELNIELADDCFVCDKAVTNTRCGKVPGVWFRSTDLSWKLPKDKIITMLARINEAVFSRNIHLDALQTLMGRINFLSMMGPFLKAFRFNLNREMALRKVDPQVRCELSAEAKKAQLVHAGFLVDKQRCPIARDQKWPMPSAVCFTTDAAGLPDRRSWSGDIRCGVVGFHHEGSMVWAAQYFWPKKFISVSHDGITRFGCQGPLKQSAGSNLYW